MLKPRTPLSVHLTSSSHNLRASIQPPRWPKSHIMRWYTIAVSKTYDDAIDILNSLQTPHNELVRRRSAGSVPDQGVRHSLMLKWLGDIGYTLDDLNHLNSIHVAGTKGKGTTCAYVDSILNSYRQSNKLPRKTGLFTSPHLIAVRERIRINTKPLSPSSFADYFFHVWHTLSSANDDFKDSVRPTYFRFLTLMSYYVFFKEQVDVSIYETGVGGQHDCTNMVPKPVVTGITSLGIDHVTTLGNTLPEIAWHKAGIQKAGCPSLTVQQAPEALEVIRARAQEQQVSSLDVIDIDPRLSDVKLSPDMTFQYQNASLAIRLAEVALTKLFPSQHAHSQSHLPPEFTRGLSRMEWQGRFEIWRTPSANWFLDGAHTPESIAITAAWFQSHSQNKKKILIFNQSGARDAANLLKCLFRATSPLRWNTVVFCTNETRAQRKDTLAINQPASFPPDHEESGEIPTTTLQERLRSVWTAEEARREIETKLKVAWRPNIKIVGFVDDAFAACGLDADDTADVLITGSLHLVGQVRSLWEVGGWGPGSGQELRDL